MKKIQKKTQYNLFFKNLAEEDNLKLGLEGIVEIKSGYFHGVTQDSQIAEELEKNKNYAGDSYDGMEEADKEELLQNEIKQDGRKKRVSTKELKAIQQAEMGLADKDKTQVLKENIIPHKFFGVDVI